MTLLLTESEVRKLADRGKVVKYVKNYAAGASLACALSNGSHRFTDRRRSYSLPAERKDGIFGRSDFMTVKLPLIPSVYTFPAVNPETPEEGKKFWAFEIAIREDIREQLKIILDDRTGKNFGLAKSRLDHIISGGKAEDIKQSYHLL